MSDAIENNNDNENENDNKRDSFGNRVMFIWSVPANGHLNPTFCFTNELLLRLDEMRIKKIVFYCDIAFKELILNLPNNIGQDRIEFRDYRLEKYNGSGNLLKLLMNFDTRPGNLFRVFQCFENSVKVGSKCIFKYMLQDIYQDKPVLILYDQALFFPKLAFTLYAKKYNCSKPLHASYVTTFLCAKGVYPHWSEMGKMGLLGSTSIQSRFKNHVVTVYDFMKYVYTYYKTLWWDYGFSFIDLLYKCDLPIGRNQIIDESLNLVFVLPEVQPRLSAFESSNIKFVGPCVDETVRSKISNGKFEMNKYISLIENFLAKNQIKTPEKELSNNYDTNNNTNNESNTSISQTVPLLSSYPSIDLTKTPTSQNNFDFSIKSSDKQVKNGFILQEISSMPDLMRSDSTGDNFKKYFKPIIYVSMGTVFNNENSNLFEIIVEACKIYSNDYSIIVSTGDIKTFEKYANSSLNSEKILFVPHTPQIEILKRASLFITHAGMNSVSEALQYGVPIICLPLAGDQPFVAWRVADELGIGIRLQPNETLTVEKVKDAMYTILNDPVYRERARDISIISNRYCGHKTAAEHLVNFLKQNEESSNKTKEAVGTTAPITKTRKKITLKKSNSNRSLIKPNKRVL